MSIIERVFWLEKGYINVENRGQGRELSSDAEYFILPYRQQSKRAAETGVCTGIELPAIDNHPGDGQDGVNGWQNK
jgi:hypothetical protein